MKSFWRKLRTPFVSSLLITLVVLLALLGGWFWLGNWHRASLIKEQRAKVAQQVTARANALTSSVNQRIALLQGLYAFTTTEWPDTHFDEPFEIYSSGIYFNSTGLRTLIIAPEGITRYVFPLFDFDSLSGYDVLNDSDPAIRADVQRAIHTRTITLSMPGTLHQGGFGLTAWRAVYRGNDLWGLVAISLDMKTILTDAGFPDASGQLDLALEDGEGHTFFGSSALWQQEPVDQQILLPEGAWELGAVPHGGWDAAIRSSDIHFRLGSLLFVLLLTALVYQVTNRQARLSEAVAVRTRQIAAARAGLEVRVEERTRELSTLLDVSREVSSSLTLTPLLGQILPELKAVLDFSEAAIFQLDAAGPLKVVSRAGAATGEPGKSLLLADEAHCRQVLASRQPLILSHWQPEGVAAPCCWLGVPLVSKDQALGLLVFVHSDPGYYTENRASLALAFAQQLAVAIENAHLYEQAGELAVLQERQRLARELHDSVSQVLYGIGLGIKSVRAALKQPSAAGSTEEALDYVAHLAEAGQVEMRALIFELRPESLQNDGLIAALEKQAAVLQKRYNLEVTTAFGEEPALALAAKETLYRVAQEATHNIVRHAHAHHASLSLQCADGRVTLEVSDDGLGFDPEASYPGHLGLHSMRERARQSGGELHIQSAPGQGTTVRFTLPLAQNSD